MAETGRGGAYLVCDGITIEIDYMAPAADESKQKVWAATFSSGFVKPFKESTMQMFMALVGAVAAECSENILNAELQLVFVKSAYIIGVYVPTMRDFDNN